jgi:hypothetical protein
VVQPLAPSAIHLIHWRLRDIRQPESRTVLKDMPTCANCHSFSADGKTLGMDIDGPANDKGLYAVVPVQKHMSIESKDMVHWNTDGRVGQTRVGFMSQVSPDGRYVVSTFAGPSSKRARQLLRHQLHGLPLSAGLLSDARHSGVVRPRDRAAPAPARSRRSALCADRWSLESRRQIHRLCPRPGAGSALRARKPALRANDPNETQIQYDLYRIPFNDGKGGVPERIVGASQNGMSNNFPKVSPDGRWIVFVQCRNGQLMRPDSQLYIVPFGGGAARRMRANTP